MAVAIEEDIFQKDTLEVIAGTISAIKSSNFQGLLSDSLIDSLQAEIDVSEMMIEFIVSSSVNFISTKYYNVNTTLNQIFSFFELTSECLRESEVTDGDIDCLRNFTKAINGIVNQSLRLRDFYLFHVNLSSLSLAIGQCNNYYSVTSVPKMRSSKPSLDFIWKCLNEPFGGKESLTIPLYLSEHGILLPGILYFGSKDFLPSSDLILNEQSELLLLTSNSICQTFLNLVSYFHDLVVDSNPLIVRSIFPKDYSLMECAKLSQTLPLDKKNLMEYIVGHFESARYFSQVYARGGVLSKTETDVWEKRMNGLLSDYNFYRVSERRKDHSNILRVSTISLVHIGNIIQRLELIETHFNHEISDNLKAGFSSLVSNGYLIQVAIGSDRLTLKNIAEINLFLSSCTALIQSLYYEVPHAYVEILELVDILELEKGFIMQALESRERMDKR
jgi:hypothetical protein